MTGVRLKQASRKGKISIEEIYQQARDGAERFGILQVGLTCVHYEPATNGKCIIRRLNQLNETISDQVACSILCQNLQVQPHTNVYRQRCQRLSPRKDSRPDLDLLVQLTAVPPRSRVLV